MRYAEDTDVPVSRSREHIEKLLEQHGATHFATMNDSTGLCVAFVINNLRVQFKLPLPSLEEVRTPKRYNEKKPVLEKRREQRTRARWRALFMCLKMKFETIESGIEVFEEAFMAHVVTLEGTVAEQVVPQLIKLAQGGKPAPLMLGGSS